MKRFYIRGAFDFTTLANSTEEAEKKLRDAQHQIYKQQGDFFKDPNQSIPINALREKPNEIIF